MKHLLNVIIYIVLLVGLEACQHQYPASLVEIDSLLNENPKAAYSKLKAIGRSFKSTNQEDYNYYYLLNLMALDRTYQSIKNTKTLENLVSYYANKQEQDKLGKAYYLQGRFLQERHEYPLALSCFHKALKAIGSQGNLKFRSLTYSQMGNMLMDLDDISLAYNFYVEAYRCDSVANNIQGLAFDLRDIAMVDIERGNKKSALEKFRKGLSLARKYQQEMLVSDIQLLMANVYLYEGESLDSVWTYLAPSLLHVNSKDKSQVYMMASEYYWSCGQEDSAKKCLSEVVLSESVFQKCEAYKRLMTISSYENDLSSMREYAECYIQLNDSISQLKEKEHKMRGQDILKFINQKDEIEELQKSNNRKLFLAILFFLLSIIFMVIFVLYYQMREVRKLKVKNQIANIKLLAFSSDARRDEKHHAIYERLQLDKYVKNKKCLSSQEWKALEMEVEKIYPHFKENISSCYKVSDFEYQICMLVKIDVGTSQIAILTAHAKPSVSMAKQRLLFKLTSEKGKAEDLNYLLKSF